MEIKGKKRNIEKHSLPNSSPAIQHSEEQGLREKGTVAGGQAQHQVK